MCPFDVFCLCYQVGWCSPCWASCVSTVCSSRVLLQTRFDLIPWTEIHHWRNSLKTAQRTRFYLRPWCCLWNGLHFVNFWSGVSVCSSFRPGSLLQTALLLQRTVIEEAVMDYLKMRRENFWKQHLKSPSATRKSLWHALKCLFSERIFSSSTFMP